MSKSNTLCTLGDRQGTLQILVYFLLFILSFTANQTTMRLFIDVKRVLWPDVGFKYYNILLSIQKIKRYLVNYNQAHIMMHASWRAQQSTHRKYVDFQKNVCVETSVARYPLFLISASESAVRLTQTQFRFFQLCYYHFIGNIVETSHHYWIVFSLHSATSKRVLGRNTFAQVVRSRSACYDLSSV